VTRLERGLRFWLDYVSSAGGLWEHAGDSALVVLPDRLGATFDLPDEVLVTADPDVAREDGVTFLASGHPAVGVAAETVLSHGDTGTVTLAPPRSLPPSAPDLLAKARERFPVDHGRIDLAAEPVRVTRSVLRVGALVTYAISTDDHFQERIEQWVDVATRLSLRRDVAAALGRAGHAAGARSGPDDARTGPASSGMRAALAEAYRLVQAAAVDRREVLAAQSRKVRDVERERAESYYAAALESLERRRATAPADRAVMLDARAHSTREERARRLVEIDEKYRPQHTVRPYRLHVVKVPALRLNVDVRRGERRYPLVLDWLLPVREFADLQCPTCGQCAPLVATKTVLGCEHCQAGRQRTTVPDPAPAPRALDPHRETGRQPTGETGRTAAAKAGRSTAEAGRPVPPAARQPAQKPAGKPARKAAERPARTAQHPAQVGRAGERLAVAFWEAAGTGQHRKIARLCAPDSPAATLVRLYGAAGPLVGVGMPAGEVPLSVTAGTYPHPVFGLPATGGEVQARTASYRYLLRWQAEARNKLAVELLPFDNPFGLGLLSPSWLRRAAGQTVFVGLPEPREELDPVARAVWMTGLPRHGLPMVLRALTAWWRVPACAALLDGHTAPVLAAAVERAACYWSRAEGGGYSDAATAHRVDEAAVRKANTALQRVLGLSREQPW
jgi:hypothetical protein